MKRFKREYLILTPSLINGKRDGTSISTDSVTQSLCTQNQHTRVLTAFSNQSSHSSQQTEEFVCLFPFIAESGPRMKRVSVQHDASPAESPRRPPVEEGKTGHKKMIPFPVSFLYLVLGKGHLQLIRGHGDVTAHACNLLFGCHCCM